MLTLTVGRNTFKICHKEGARTTVWDVSSESTEDELIQTFKDVVSFVEGEPQSATILRADTRQELDAMVEWHRRAPSTAPVTGNGWATPAPVAPPELPEDRQGDWELIQPGEDA